MKRILVVEDDPINATMIFDYLTSKGYDVALVMNGDEAVEKFKSLDPDLMIIDVLLPKKNGFNVCMEIQRIHGGIRPVIMMSAVHNDAQTQEFVVKELHVTSFLPKPFKLKDLLIQVESIFAPEAA